jgi:hypothetical protein
MTITFNVLSLLQFVTILGWGIIACMAMFGMIFSSDKGDRVFGGLLILLCMLSMAMLWFGRA